MQSNNYSVRQSDDEKNLNWLNQFQGLLEYKKQYGHCNVASTYEHQILFQWVNHQRHAKLSMSDERINMLNSIGFNWWHLDNWTDKFEELKHYKSKHGDCNVPVKYDENQPLAKWVLRQRTQFKQSKLLEERINMLNAIGFNWGASKSVQRVRKLNATAWKDNFEQLKLYKSKHGHCNVPKQYHENQPLANWVKTQRSQFKHSKMSQERINMLNAIGFNWSISKASAWNNRFEDLKIYKSKHGDCNVPRKYDENQPLAYWVHLQRSYFRCSNLSEERLNMLNTIGFNWTAPNRMNKTRHLKNHEHIAIETSYQDSNEKEEHAVGKEQIVIGASYQDSKEKETTTYTDSREKEEPHACNEIYTKQDDSDIEEVEENHEPIAIETSYQDSKENETTTTEKEDNSFKTSLHERVEVLCKISIMFQEQKDVIHANMKKRKLSDSA